MTNVFRISLALTAFSVVVATGVVTAGPARAGKELSRIEKIYAKLAKLPAEERHKRIVAGARKEGVLSLSAQRGKLGRKWRKAFAKRYPFVKLENFDIGGQQKAARLVAEETAGRHLTDLLSLGVPDLPTILKLDLIARYPTPMSARILKRYEKFKDPENRWLPWYMSEHGLSYNPKMLTPEQAPKSWEDLCKPQYKGMVSFEPAETRFLVGMYNVFGEDFGKFKNWVDCIGKNKPIIQRGHRARLTLMLAGDHAIGGDQYFYSAESIRRKRPKKTHFTEVYTAPVLGWAVAVVINKNAPHPYAAALFADWVLSKESQKIIYKGLRGPLTGPHPFIPASAKIVEIGAVDESLVKKLHGYWIKVIGKVGQRRKKK